MAETDRHEPQIYQLRVVLRGISPLIWRRLLIVHNFEQIFPTIRFQGLKRPVVENQDLDFGERHEAPFVDTFAAGDTQLLEQARQPGVQRTLAEAAGFLRARRRAISWARWWDLRLVMADRARSIHHGRGW
jgi:hypothetical protein